MKPHSAVLSLAVLTAAAYTAVEPKASQAPAPAPADARQQVLNVGKEWAAAEDRNDQATVRHIIDDRFVFSYGAEKPVDKEAYIKAILGDFDPTQKQALSDETVIVDRDTAVVVGTDTVHGTEKGKAYVVTYRYTVTYLHRDGRWVALAEHLVKVPESR
jgi:ketosteroid isomerase-like protein